MIEFSLAETVSVIQHARYTIVSMCALQACEFMANFAREVRLIHQAPWSSMKGLYLLCRYYPIIIWPLVTWSYVGDHTFLVCDKATYPTHALIAPCQFFSQAVMLMRAYAFTGRKWQIKILLTVCYAGLVGVDLWVFCGPLTGPPPIFYFVMPGMKSGCFPNYGGDFKALPIGYSMLAATLMDFISLVVMLIYGKKSGYDSISLGQYFINQGVVAFLLVCCVNIGAAVAFFRPPRVQDAFGLPLVVIVGNIAACRIILRIREKVYPTETILVERYSNLVRHAFHTQRSDAWVIDD